MREYTFEEFNNHVEGWGDTEKRLQAMEWDRTRTIMFAVVKGAGSKIKSPKDLITIPEIDGEGGGPVRENLIKRLQEFNAKAKRTD